MTLDIFTSPRRWVISILMIAFAYFAYYNYAGQQMLQQYQAALWNSKALAKDISGLKDVEITVLIPKFIADAELLEQELIIHLINNSDDAQVIQIGITGTVEKESNAFVTGHLKGEGGKSGASSYIKLEVPPRSSTTETLLVSAINSGGITSEQELSVLFTLFANSKPLVFKDGGSQDGNVYAKFNRFKAFQQTAVRALIFPPFSNGFLVLIPLFLTWFAEPTAKFLVALVAKPLLARLPQKQLAQPSGNQSPSPSNEKTTSQEPLCCTQCGKPIKQCPLCHNPPEEFSWNSVGKFVAHVVITFILLILTYYIVNAGLLNGDPWLSGTLLTVSVLVTGWIYVLEDTHRHETT